MRQSGWRTASVVALLAALSVPALSILLVSRGEAGQPSSWKDRQTSSGGLTAFCAFGTPTASDDSDNDELDDAAELSLGTGQCDPDSDDDTLLDGREVNGMASPKSALGTLFSDPLDPDTDDDKCTDDQELGADQTVGGRRDPQNEWDYFNPTHDGKNRVDDILAVVDQYFVDQANPNYTQDTDRTLVGPNAWSLGAPNGLQRIDDILNIVRQYFHDCA